MRATAIAVASCSRLSRKVLAIRAAARRPPARRRKTGGGDDNGGVGNGGAGDGGRKRRGGGEPANERRAVFQLWPKTEPASLQEVAEAYEACSGLAAGPQRDACYIVHNLDGRMVERYYHDVRRMEAALGAPSAITRRHLQNARAIAPPPSASEALPPSDTALPETDAFYDSDDTE